MLSILVVLKRTGDQSAVIDISFIHQHDRIIHVVVYIYNGAVEEYLQCHPLLFFLDEQVIKSLAIDISFIHQHGGINHVVVYMYILEE